MSNTMNQEKRHALAEERVKDLKTPADLKELSAQLTKLTVEAALKAEMNHPTIKMSLKAIIVVIVVMDTPLKHSKVGMVKSTCKHRVTAMPVLNRN